MAVTHRDTLGVVTALRTDVVVDLLGHQLRQHPETGADAERQQPSLRGAGKARRARPARVRATHRTSSRRSRRQLRLRSDDRRACWGGRVRLSLAPVAQGEEHRGLLRAERLRGRGQTRRGPIDALAARRVPSAQRGAEEVVAARRVWSGVGMTHRAGCGAIDGNGEPAAEANGLNDDSELWGAPYRREPVRPGHTPRGATVSESIRRRRCRRGRSFGTPPLQLIV